MDVLISALFWALKLSLLFTVAMYAVGPLLVWRMQRSPAEVRFLRLKDNSLLKMVSPACEAQERELLAAGFTLADSASMALGSTQTYFSVYRDDDGLLASLVAMKGQTQSLFYLEFTWLHPDGAVTNVNNSGMASVFPTSALKRSYRYPDLATVPELLALARQIGRVVGKDFPIQPFPAGQELDSIEHFLTRESEALVARGWYAPAVVDGYRRLTLRGAFLMSWRLLWPQRQLLQRAERRQAALMRHSAVNITSQN